MTIADDIIHRFTRAEYRQMAESGVFNGQRVELLEGKVVDVSPQNEPHITVVSRLLWFLADSLDRKRFEIRCQAPVGASDVSEPEPDYAVIEKLPDELAEHPASALLAIEVSDTTLAKDRMKARIYAAARIQEYWIININGRTVEQYTEPRAELGEYAVRRVLKEAEQLQCTVLPLPGRPVREFLPMAK